MAPVVIGVTANGRAGAGVPVSTAATRIAVGRTRSVATGLASSPRQSRRASLDAARPPSGTRHSRSRHRPAPRVPAAATRAARSAGGRSGRCRQRPDDTRVDMWRLWSEDVGVRCLERTGQSRKATAHFVGREAARDWNPDRVDVWRDRARRLRRRDSSREYDADRAIGGRRSQCSGRRIESDRRQRPRRVRQPGGARLPQDPVCDLPRPERGPDCPPPATRERQRARASR